MRTLSIVALIVLGTPASLAADLPRSSPEEQGIPSQAILSFIGGAEKDIDAYLGLEYDVIGIEEATTLSSRKHRDITTCCRTSKPNWRPATGWTCFRNPPRHLVTTLEIGNSKSETGDSLGTMQGLTLGSPSCCGKLRPYVAMC